MISTPPQREGARLWFATACVIALGVYLNEGWGRLDSWLCKLGVPRLRLRTGDNSLMEISD
jgi:hypothetical protein